MGVWEKRSSSAAGWGNSQSSDSSNQNSFVT
jgi:hypothetical protein